MGTAFAAESIVCSACSNTIGIIFTNQSYFIGTYSTNKLSMSISRVISAYIFLKDSVCDILYSIQQASIGVYALFRSVVLSAVYRRQRSYRM